jgi:hypothetical protein
MHNSTSTEGAPIGVIREHLVAHLEKHGFKMVEGKGGFNPDKKPIRIKSARCVVRARRGRRRGGGGGRGAETSNTQI